MNTLKVDYDNISWDAALSPRRAAELQNPWSAWTAPGYVRSGVGSGVMDVVW